MSLTEWTARHNRWADGEVAESRAPKPGRVRPDARGNPAQRKEIPPSEVRPHAALLASVCFLFVYRHQFRLGSLDRTEGLIFWVLQNFLVPFSRGCQNLGATPRRTPGWENLNSSSQKMKRPARS